MPNELRMSIVVGSKNGDVCSSDVKETTKIMAGIWNGQRIHNESLELKPKQRSLLDTIEHFELETVLHI